VAYDVVLALGLLLTTASQLRVPGLPIGPGEVCLAIWILLMVFRETGRFGPPWPELYRGISSSGRCSPWLRALAR
jgi:hypothetical protein